MSSTTCFAIGDSLAGVKLDDRVEKICGEILDLPPSCIEFSLAEPEYFVIGTYNLEKDEASEVPEEEGDDEEKHEEVKAEEKEKKAQSRNGSLMLWRYADREITMVHTVTYPSAILDLHFSPHKPSIFAVASSTGSISLYTLTTDPRHSIIHLHTFSVFPTSTLVLSLAWHPTHPLILGVTLSTSTVALLNFSQSYDALSILREDISPHDDLEAWTLAFTPPFPNTRSMPQAVYSGGDDSKLRCLNFPSLASLAQKPEELVDLSAGGKMGMRGHGAGVTAILPLPVGAEAGRDILLTGSYDDYVRVFAVSDYRPGQNGKPKVLAEKNLGGGVWRLRFLREYARRKAPVADEERRFRVLASCMHAGARVLEVVGSREGEWRIEVLGEFTEHESMNYGSDVLPIVSGNKEERLNDSEAICVSTSFYDKRLCVWRWKSK